MLLGCSLGLVRLVGHAPKTGLNRIYDANGFMWASNFGMKGAVFRNWKMTKVDQEFLLSPHGVISMTCRVS